MSRSRGEVVLVSCVEYTNATTGVTKWGKFALEIGGDLSPSTSGPDS